MKMIEALLFQEYGFLAVVVPSTTLHGPFSLKSATDPA